jgi:ABC-2 type transport system permease protein
VTAILKRELQAYFVSPVAYAFMTMFLVVVAFGFSIGVMRYAATPAVHLERFGWSLRTQLVSGTWGLVTWGNLAALISLPGLSMRLLAEERKNGTAELLFTSPLTTPQIVLGKYLGSLALYALILVLTLPLPGFLVANASPELGALACAYLGLFLFGAVLLAVGLFASSLTENQFIALVLTYALIVPLTLVEFVVPLVLPPYDRVLGALSLGFALKAAALGAVDTAYLALHAVLVTAFLFLAVRVIDSQRWR